MKITDIDLKGFERRRDLQKIGRYSAYSKMHYRPDVFFHSIKLFHLINWSLPQVVNIFGDTFDPDKALVMGLVHDDAEIITGDFQSIYRDKISPEELAQLNNNEKEAIYQLSKIFPETIHGYNYKDLLLEVEEKNTLESQVVKYLDHLDGFCEALHELYAGNKLFAEPLTDKDFGDLGSPYEYYVPRFNDIKKRYPLLQKLVSTETPFLLKYEMPDVASIFANGSSHTLENLHVKTGNISYDWWKNVLLNNLTEEELKNLYIVKE